MDVGPQPGPRFGIVTRPRAPAGNNVSPLPIHDRRGSRDPVVIQALARSTSRSPDAQGLGLGPATSISAG
jgi:hypothetical protein